MQRTIHVKGDAMSPDYNEAAPIILASRVALTSAYNGASGGANLVRIVAAGSCASVAGTGVACAVGIHNDAMLQRVSVTTRPGSTATHAIVTSNAGLVTGSAPTLFDVIAGGASGHGIFIPGSAVLGPRVSALNNAQNGLTVQPSASSPGFTRPTVTIDDVALMTGDTPSNRFSQNSGNGAVFFGDVVVQVNGGIFSSNGNNGVVMGTPLLAMVAGQPTHQFRNVNMNENRNHGLRLNSGDLLIRPGTVMNTFNNNEQGYGIETAIGDGSGGARLTMEASFSGSGGFAIAHQANSNAAGGVHIAQVVPAGMRTHQIYALEALRNGLSSSSISRADGVFVEVIGANQPSLMIRGSTMIGNTGSGLRFQQGITNSLDMGNVSMTIDDGGYNVFAANNGTNMRTAVCIDNATPNSLVQQVEHNRWATTPCPFPLTGMPNPAFISLVGACNANMGYIDITYTGTTSFSALTCY